MVNRKQASVSISFVRTSRQRVSSVLGLNFIFKFLFFLKDDECLAMQNLTLLVYIVK